jgi:hypothetical protein
MGERLAKGSKRFFFEKKNQKLLSIKITATVGWASAHHTHGRR